MLSDKLSLRYPFECTVSGAIEELNDVLELARGAAEVLNTLMGGALALESLEGWEFIGKAFNLYSFGVASLASPEPLTVAVLRVVEVGGVPLGVFGAFRREAVTLLPGAEAAELAGRISAGNMIEGPVYLEPLGAGQPPGQSWGRFVTYYVEGETRLPRGEWKIRVRVSRGSEGIEFTLGELWRRASRVSVDFHCVTGWSVKGVEWVGVPLTDLFEEAGLGRPRWVAAVSDTGYSAVFPGEYLSDAIVALGVDGRPLDPDRGAPARLVVPPLYGWKSVKRLTEVMALDYYQDGYWEALGYHERGLAAAVERFKVRNRVLAGKPLPLESARPLKPPSRWRLHG